MSEWRLFKGDLAEVSTREYHLGRERGRHLEQHIDRERLQVAAILCLIAQRRLSDLLGYLATVSDLGCGDGGLLSLLAGHVAGAWGYDFTPANIDGCKERGVTAELVDVFNDEGTAVKFGDVTAVTEVLEHLTDPHAAVRWIAGNSRYIVASSPWDETDEVNCDCHSWAWDMEGYRALLAQGGYRIVEHILVGRFQVVLGERE